MRNVTPALSTFMRDFDELFNDFGRGFPDPKKSDLEIELPFAGLSKEDVSIQADENLLTVSVTKKELSGFAKRHEGFKRTYLADPDYDLTRVIAKMENGLLLLKLPLKEQAKKTQFQIAVN